ncbi:MAG: hypothetical protein AB7I25_09380 [Vicinamibacterales bacterium]
MPRRRYVVFDRHRLPYLNALDKANCTYCAYANGVFAYAREIAGRTEQYWCPIKHRDPPPSLHEQYRDFAEYGDSAGYHGSWRRLRAELKEGRRV